MSYVDKKLYTGSSFFRVCTPANEANRKVKIQVIQGGNVPANLSLDSIKIETTNITGLHHKNGTVSMARSAPNSATSEFFICINDQPALDYAGARNPDGQGFAAFGKVNCRDGDCEKNPGAKRYLPIFGFAGKDLWDQQGGVMGE